MAADAVLVLDCGATNVRAIVVSAAGKILASRSVANTASPDPENSAWRIWDQERIWRDFSACAQAVAREVGQNCIGAVTVTTFGVDGTLVDGNGRPLFPVISWQCERSKAVFAHVEAVIGAAELHRRSGLQPFHFNTIYKLIWLQAHRPDLVRQAKAWLFISNLFVFRLTGRLATDTTMAGTSMLTELATRAFSSETLQALDLDPALFPPLVEPGTVVGELLAAPAQDLGLPPGLPVVSAGHDTQFALFGSGAKEGEPVLSSGTWEILMVRTPQVIRMEELHRQGVTIEFDAVPGLMNPGVMWIGSGLVEWLKHLAFSDLVGDAAYETMITEGTAAGVGAGGVTISGDFLNRHGVLAGLGMSASRGQMARALFESLAFQTRAALHLLETASGCQAERLVCVGGGSKNRLWNQIRADVLNRPVVVIHEKETTVIGAAIFAFPAAGIARNLDDARRRVELDRQEILPGPDASKYQKLLTQSQR